MSAFLPNFPHLYGLLLHGNNVDDVLIIGVAAYLIIMFGLSRLKVHQLKRRKHQKAAQKEKALPVEEGPEHNNLT